MKIDRFLSIKAMALLLLLCVRAFAQSVPQIPNEFFQFFPPDYVTDYGSVPIAYSTNLITTWATVSPYYGDVLILDTTNLSPSYLEYYVSDTNWNANIEYDVGTILFFFEPNWASVSQGGTGPGQTAYFIGGGDWTSGSSNGLFRIYADAAGSNIVFGGIEAHVTNTYASAPISWSSNSWHEIQLEWKSTASRIYLDGVLAATGSGASMVPVLGTDTNGFYTNGFFIGSDNNGYEQARGAFWNMDTWAEYGQVYDNTNGWLALSNALETWQASLGGGFGGMMAMGGLGLLNPTNCNCGCISNTTVQLSNIGATNIPGLGTIFSFSIEGGKMGTNYDVFTTTNLVGDPATNSVWTWLGRGTNCGTYTVLNQATNASYYIVGGPNLAGDGSGNTMALEQLIPNWNWAAPNNTNTLSVTIVSPAQGAILQ